MVSRHELPVLEQRVLETLTESIKTASVVRLAADMWRGKGDLGADPVGLIQDIVESLNQMGLVTYRLEPVGSSIYRQTPYTGFGTDVRLSPAGWALMGYPITYLEAGTPRASHAHLDPKGDRTNYRKHSDTAEGVGPIEKLPFAEHMAKYPTHRHGDNVMPRNYIKVTDKLEAEVLAYRGTHPTADYQSIGDELDIPPRTVKYILTELPRLRRMADGEDGPGSLRQRIIVCLQELDIKDVPALRRILGRADDEHNIVHVLHNLHKAGIVDFAEHGPDKTPINIHLTSRYLLEDKKRRVTYGTPDHEPVRLNGETPIEKSEEPTTAPEGYPLLDELLAREGERLNADNTALRYLEAADLIRDNDPETAALLDDKARKLDVTHPSPLELEYMRYVREHA